MATPEITVFDELHPCSYLPGRTARLPHRHPVQRLAPEEFDARLAEGDRRSGLFLYRTQCPECQACEPIRLEMGKFRPNATQRRELRRGDALFDVRLGEPTIDQRRIDLFNRHRRLRKLDQDDIPLDDEGYRDFLTATCCDTWELSYWRQGELVGVAIVDAGREAMSAVYTYFEPELGGLALGTYSVLREAQLCRESGRRYLYLGFYIAQSPHMAYKARFHPHQRRISGNWRDFS